MNPRTDYDTQSNGLVGTAVLAVLAVAVTVIAGLYFRPAPPTTTYYVVMHDPCSAFGAPQPCTVPAHAVSVHKDIEKALREVRKDHINRRMSTIEGEKQ
jgi:hypothetical protein